MSDKNLLNVKDLYVDVEDKEILHGVNLSIGKGETAAQDYIELVNYLGLMDNKHYRELAKYLKGEKK